MLTSKENNSCLLIRVVTASLTAASFWGLTDLRRIFQVF